MTRERLDAALRQCPLVAILRGIRPDEIVAVADALVDLGYSMIEVPLNSPDPLDSLARIGGRYDPAILIGAGTVLSAVEVMQVQQAGGSLVVAPNANPRVIAEGAKRNMVVLPGFATPTEAFAAIEAGATGLKFFPAEAASPKALRAQRSVLPKDMPILVVGGIQPTDMADWSAAGADGFGLGSGLFAPGMTARDVAARAALYQKALRGEEP